MEKFIVTTTDNIERGTIESYHGVINVNIVIGTNLFSDIAASFTDIFGGQSESYQKKMNSMYDMVQNKLILKAKSLGANAIVGFRIDFDEISGKGKGMLMISGIGTACFVHYNAAIDKDISNSHYSINANDLNTQVEIKKAVDKAKESISLESLTSQEWELIMEQPEIDLLDKMILYSSAFDEKKVDLYISKFSPDEVIPYLYEKSMTDRIVCKIIKNCNLFDPNSILKFIDVNLRRVVSLLDSDKLYYSNDDLKLMKEICDKLERLPDKGQIVRGKTNILGKEHDIYICQNGHKNEIESEFCTKCTLDVKGLNYNDRKTISRFKSKVELLSEMLSSNK